MEIAGIVGVKATWPVPVHLQGSLVRSRETGRLPCDEPSSGGRTTGSCEYHIISTFSVTTGKDCVVDGLVNGVSASVLIDMGAALSVLNKAMWGEGV